MKFSLSTFLVFLSFTLFAGKPERPLNELYRPQFHFTPERNWHNDPNGLVYYDGEYHLFYQYNPNGLEWGYMHWGHAVSNDLVHWEHLPIALTPDESSTDKAHCTEFSGCGLVDEKNLTGLQQGSEKTILLFYTSFECGQRLAYSTDRGRTWQKYAKNPIIPFDSLDDARDPKVFWHEKSQQYVMVLYRKPDGNEKAKGISFYTSKNLTDWEFKNHIPGFFECPDLVELPVNRRPDDKRWVLFDGDGSYMIGNFDGERFTPETAKMKGDYGRNYYATQTWSNIPEKDGRVIQIAWMRDGEFPGMPFKGQMTFPCELSLRKYIDGIYLLRKPVQEIELLHEKGNVWENKNLIPGIKQNIVSKVKGDCLHIIADFSIKSSDNFGFMVRTGKKATGTEILYNVKSKTLSCLGASAVVEPIDGKLKLEILLDRSSIEIFANDGKTVMSSCFSPEDGAEDLILYTNGGELLVNKMEIYPLKSIWEPKEK